MTAFSLIRRVFLRSATLFFTAAAALAAWAPSARADLDEWTLQNTGNASARQASLIVGNSTLFVAGGNFIETSPNGSAWTARSYPGADQVSWIHGAAGGGKFVLLGSDYSAIVSANGSSWSTVDFGNVSAFYPYVIAWNGTQFFATDGPSVFSSSDGINWTAHSTNSNIQAGFIACSSSNIVLGGYSGMAYSSDGGAHWTTSRDPVSQNISAMVGNSSIFVAVGGDFQNGGPLLYTSTDGNNWTQREIPLSDSTYVLTQVIWTGRNFVAIGYDVTYLNPNGVMLSSPDGITWGQNTVGDFGGFSVLGQSGNRLILVTGSGLALAEDGASILRPFISTPPANQTVVLGKNATFSVVAGGTGPFTYQWLYNNVALSGETKATLVVKKVTADDAGKYSVKITGPGGSVTSAAATLKVVKAIVPVNILVQPSPLAAFARTRPTLGVVINASATDPVTYQWFKGSTALSNSPTGYGGVKTDTLIFKSLTKADAGLYHVEITNPADTTSSVTVRVTVR